MGSCLSKSGKKGKGDEVDKAPYAPAPKNSPAAEKPRDIEEIPLKSDAQYEKGKKGNEPVTVKQASQHQPSKQETVKPSAKEAQPSVSKIFIYAVLLTQNFPSTNTDAWLCLN